MVPALPIILFFFSSTLPAVPCRAAVLLVIVVRSLVVECVEERVVCSSLLSPCHLTAVIVGMFVEKAKNYRNHHTSPSSSKLRPRGWRGRERRWFIWAFAIVYLLLWMGWDGPERSLIFDPNVPFYFNCTCFVPMCALWRSDRFFFCESGGNHYFSPWSSLTTESRTYAHEGILCFIMCYGNERSQLTMYYGHRKI